MGGVTIGQLLVLLALMALAIKALAKPDIARKLIVVIAVGSAAPLSFAAVNLVAKLVTGPQSTPNSDTFNADITDLSSKAEADAGPYVPRPNPAPTHPLNPFPLLAKLDVPGCRWPDELQQI